MIFSGLLNSIVVACPGCSFQGTRLRLQYPGDVVWAWLIVVFVIFAIPLLMLCGMRFSRRCPRPKKKQTTWLTVIWIVIFMLSGSSSFAGIMITLIFLPLVIILIILIDTLTPVAIIIVPLYIYAMVKVMQRFDRKIYWRNGKVWCRLRNIKNKKMDVIVA